MSAQEAAPTVRYELPVEVHVRGMERCANAATLVVLAACGLAVASALGSNVCELHKPSDRQSDFDILVLAMQWPASACIVLDDAAGDACRSPPAAFVVRGLWPTRVVGVQPRCCHRGNFSVAAIADLTPQLRHLWPVLSRGASATELWESQWMKHGSCTGLSCRSYFRRVVELARRFDFLRALSAQGIVASDHRTHRLADVQSALDAAVGGSRVNVRCRKSWKGSVLDSIHVCLDSSGSIVGSCPTKCNKVEDDCCGARLRIPFWSRDNGSGSFGRRNRSTSTGGHGENRNAGGAVPDPAGYWTGQVVGICVLVGGAGFWIFKQATLDRRRTGTGMVDGYQRIS